MPYHEVVSGETLSGIGVAYGVDWRRIWEAPENAELRERNGDPDRIFPGDVFWVPGAGAIEGVLAIDPPEEEGDGRLCPALHAGCPLVEEYKVRTGDTLESVAESIGMTWRELAIFNWDTDDPDEINWYLGNYFVCRKKVGANYVFTDEDEPGILYLPRGVEPGGRRARRGVFYASRWKPE